MLKEIGFFNEQLPVGYDGDVCYRIRKRGYKIVYEPEAVVYHFHRPTLRSYFKQQFSYGKNTVHLILEWLDIVKGDTLNPKSMILQPVLFYLMVFTVLLSFFLYFILGFATLTVFIVPVVCGLILLLLNLYLTLRVFFVFRDPVILIILPLVLLTRVVAWSLGGLAGLINLITSKILLKIRSWRYQS